MRFLPGDSSSSASWSSALQTRGEQERLKLTRWRLHAHRKQPRAEISKHRSEGQPRQQDGAHQTIVQESQGNRNARGPGNSSAHISFRAEPQSHAPRRSQPAPRLARQSREALQHPLALIARGNVGAAPGPPRAMRQQQRVTLPSR